MVLSVFAAHPVLEPSFDPSAVESNGLEDGQGFFSAC
jgi:hypothetical protein